VFSGASHRSPTATLTQSIPAFIWLLLATASLPQAPPLKASNWKIWFANDIDLWNVVPD
jgi:hypothetical protein